MKYIVEVWFRNKAGYNMKKGIAGFVYENMKLEEKRDNRLWLNGSCWKQAFFNSREEAKKAIKITEDGHLAEGFFHKVRRC